MESMLKWHAGLAGLLNFLGAITIALMALLICADVVGRAFFGLPIFGVPEIVKISVVAIAWLQMAHTLRIGAHLRTTVLVDRMSGRARRIATIIATLLGMAMFALIVYAGWHNMVEAWRIGEFEGDHPVRVPTAPVHTIVLLGAALTAIQFAVLLAEAIGVKDPERRAVESAHLE